MILYKISLYLSEPLLGGKQ